jgi:Domain of unknown function (DUF4168)
MITMLAPQQHRCLFLIFLSLRSCLAVTARASSMPTFFSADEARYDRYAACLAATEKLRRDCCNNAAAAAGGITASEEYAKQASHILNGLGSSLDEYNAIGREVLQNKDLKQRVRPSRHNRAVFFSVADHAVDVSLYYP